MVLYVLALLMHIIYVMWQVGVGIAMDNDSHRRNFTSKEAENISRHRLEYDHENPNSGRKIVIIEDYIQQLCHLGVIWTDWSRLLLVGIPTILFIIIVDLFTKKFWDITICCRILLSVIPILILLISVGAWIAKKIKKNRENKLDRQPTTKNHNTSP